MRVLTIIGTALAVQVVTGFLFDLLIDGMILLLLWVWIKAPDIIPAWVKRLLKL